MGYWDDYVEVLRLCKLLAAAEVLCLEEPTRLKEFWMFDPPF